MIWKRIKPPILRYLRAKLKISKLFSQKRKILFNVIILVLLIFGTFLSTFSFVPPAKKAQAQSYDQIETYGTINSGSIRIRPIPEEVTSATLEYRKQGTTPWSTALPPVITVANALLESKGDIPYEDFEVVDPAQGAMIRRLHGSVMYLIPDTLYDLKAILYRANETVYDTVETTVQTKPDTVTYGSGNTLTVGPGETYTTIQSAINAAVAGDTIEITAGTYNEMLDMTVQAWRPNFYGTEGNPITIRGLPGAIVANRDPLTNDNWINNTHDIIIEGLTFSGTLQSKLYFYDTTSYRTHDLYRIVIQDCTFINDTGTPSGAFISSRSTPGNEQDNCYEITIQNNTFQSVPGMGTGHGIFIVGGTGFIIRNNIMDFGPCQDMLAIRSGPRYDMDIYNNIITGDPTDDVFELEGGVNINVRVWNNTINGYAGNRASISNTPVLVGPMYVFRNTFYGAAQWIKVASDAVRNAIAAGIDLADFGPLFYYHNSYYIALDKPVVGGEQHMIFRYDYYMFHMNLTFKNNLVYGTKMTDNVGKAITNYDRNDDELGYYWGDIKSDYNIFWDGEGEGVNPNEAYGLDLNSMFQDPGIVKTTWPDPDLHLLWGSPAIDQGIVLPNINGNYLGSAPDLGALEYADITAPTLAEVTPVPDPTSDPTPNYTFSSDEAGTITYVGDCSSADTTAEVGNNTVTFNTLAEGLHNNCTIIVTDSATNPSDTLNITSFTVDLSDTDPPTDFNLRYPSHGAWTKDTTPIFYWYPSSDTDSGLKYYRLYIDGQKKKTVSGSATSATFRVPLSRGTHHWYVVAVDNVGNTKQSTTTRHIRIDTIRPRLTITYPSATNWWTYGEYIPIKGTVYDGNSRVSSVNILNHANNFRAGAKIYRSGSSGKFNRWIRLKMYTCNRVVVTAKDRAGNYTKRYLNIYQIPTWLAPYIYWY